MTRSRTHSLEKVHRATTRQEKEAIYRFRYSVYVEELGRELGHPDHQRRWVHDADDDAPWTTLLCTGSIDDITGTVRLRHWQPGEVPTEEIEEQSMELFPDLGRRRTGEIGRLMVKPSLRGRTILAAFLRELYLLLDGEVEVGEPGAGGALPRGRRALRRDRLLPSPGPSHGLGLRQDRLPAAGALRALGGEALPPGAGGGRIPAASPRRSPGEPPLGRSREPADLRGRPGSRAARGSRWALWRRHPVSKRKHISEIGDKPVSWR